MRVQYAMRARPAIALGIAVTVAFGALLVTPASAAGWGVNWQMNEESGPMLDSSGNGNASSSVGAGISRNGSIYYFASPNSNPSRGVITVPDSPSLRPGTRAFSIEARIKPWRGDRNVIQKGTYSANGHQWKLEIVGNAYNCVFHGGGGDQRVGNATGVKDTVKAGMWQTVICRRTATEIQLLVDGQLKARKVANPGFIGTFGKPVTIGGKSDCGTHCDLYAGYMDSIQVTSP